MVKLTLEELLEASASPNLDPERANDEMLMREMLSAESPEPCSRLECKYRSPACHWEPPVRDSKKLASKRIS